MLNAFSLRLGTRQAYLLSPLLLNIVLKVQDDIIRKKLKTSSLERKKTVFVLRWHNPVHENPKEYHTHTHTHTHTNTQVELINDHSKVAAAAAAALLQLCPTVCDPIDGSPPGSPVPGILQARTLEWAAISFSNAGKWKVKGKSLSRVRLLATPWTAAHQAPPSMGFSRQEYWSGVPLPSPRSNG